MILFLGGLFLVATMVRPGTLASEVATRGEELARLGRWNSFVTTPALVLVWAAGLYLATRGGWLPARWLHLKIACVMGLTILHVLQSLRLRSLMAGREDANRLRWIIPIAGLLVVLIVYFVTAKPH